MQYLILGNFGNHSLAALQALIELRLANLHFVYVDTGWSSASWPSRVQEGSEYAISHGVTVYRLKAKLSFSELVLQRKQFPCQKFQWCASFLKGLTISDFLEHFDPECEAIIVTGKRRYDSRRYTDLQEFEDGNDLYQGRAVWNPLWNTTNEAWKLLISRTGFEVLPHQSLECSPCIHYKPSDLFTLDSSAVKRLETLEKQVKQAMFIEPIKQMDKDDSLKHAATSEGLSQFDRGCGAAWGCGE